MLSQHSTSLSYLLIAFYYSIGQIIIPFFIKYNNSQPIICSYLFRIVEIPGLTSELVRLKLNSRLSLPFFAKPFPFPFIFLFAVHGKTALFGLLYD